MVKNRIFDVWYIVMQDDKIDKITFWGAIKAKFFSTTTLTKKIK